MTDAGLILGEQQRLFNPLNGGLEPGNTNNRRHAKPGRLEYWGAKKTGIARLSPDY